MKLAIFHNAEHNYESVCQPAFESIEGYTRISEYVEVEFPPLPRETIVNSKIGALRDQKKTIQAETEARLQEIDQQIADLLALPAPKEPTQ